MAQLEQIVSPLAVYSENILPISAMFEETATINQAGSSAITVSQISTSSFEGNKCINVFGNTDAALFLNKTFNFGSDITAIAKRTGSHIFSLKLKNNTVFATDVSMTLTAYLYVNGLLVQTYTTPLVLGAANVDNWITLAQSFNLNAGDVWNMTFEAIIPPAVEPNANISIDLDGFKLENDDRFLGIPSVYSFPREKNNIPNNFVIVSELTDLPVPVTSVITLASNTSYYFVNKVDLASNKLVLSNGTIIRGTSSINAGIQNGGMPLISTFGGCSINDISIENNGQVFSINSTPSTDNIFINDCTFLNCTALGTVTNVASLIFSNCSLINCGSLNVGTGGTVGTFAIDNSACIPINTVNQFVIPATATISRRIRITNTSFTLDNVAAAFNVSASATIPDEKWIISLCNFIGTSANYFDGGINHTSNKSLFINNTGITNTTVKGQAYMQANATATVIGSPSTFVKVAGTTTAGTLSKYLMPVSNRLTCDAAIRRDFLVVCQISFTSTNNQNVEFGFFDSTLGGIRPASRIIQNTGGAGIPQALAIFAEISHIQGDYIELHVANNTAANNVTVSSMNYIITEV